jgi:hypothetical protein
MSLSKFTPGCCCGGGDCTVFSDNFDRTSIGSNWTVRSGSWSCDTVGGGELTTTGSNAEVDQSAGGFAGKAQATVSGSGQLQVGLGSSGSFVAAELDTAAGQFSIVGVGGGTRTVLRSCPADDDSATIALCSDTYPYGGTTIRLFTAFFNGTAMLSWGDSIGPCETFGGVLATGTLGGTASFTGYRLSTSHCESADCPSCGQCCWPLGPERPSQVRVDISGLGGAATTLGATPCTDSQCTPINGTYYLDPADDCSASYTSCPDMPCCACYELTDLALPCNSVAPEPITTIRFMAFNSDGAGCQGPGQCNLYVELSTAGGFVVFHFDLGLGAAPVGFDPSQACGSYDPSGGCGSATLIANNYTTASTPGGLRCRHDTLDDPTSATAVVSPL